MQRYFLFVRRKDYPAYIAEFERIRANREKGKPLPPVFCELRSAKVNMVENLPYTLWAGAFIVLGTLAVRALGLDELLSIAAVIHATALPKTEEGWNIVQQRHLRGGWFDFAEAFLEEEAKG